MISVPLLSLIQLESCVKLSRINKNVSLDNIKFFKDNIPNLLEVSIGHALISESLYLGLENVVNMYLQKLK